MNLRGVRESGIAFSVPTYVFIVMMIAMIGIGSCSARWTGSRPPAPSPTTPVSPSHHGFWNRRIRARVSHSARIRRRMRRDDRNRSDLERRRRVSASELARTPRRTLGWMAAILAVFFLGTSILARHYVIMPSATETVLSQLGRRILGGGAAYYALQFSTFAILVLAANTAFADFPRLSSILAATATCRGNSRRAATGWRSPTASSRSPSSRRCSSGCFGGETSALIPLYAIGVFVCFTLSQAGMVDALVSRARAGLAATRGAQRHRRGCHRARFDRAGRDEVHAWRMDRRADHSADHRRASTYPPPLRVL